MRSILAYFNGLREKHAARKELEEKYDKALLAVANASPAISDLVDDRYSRMQRCGLLYAAINAGNPDTFSLVHTLVANGDPNFRLVSESNPYLNYVYHHEQYSLLYTAITHNRPEIALKLAEDPRTNIGFSGFDKTEIYHSGSFSRPSTLEKRNKDCESCLEAARAAGMDDVVKVLARREADLLRERAAALQAEAGLSPKLS